MFDFAVYVWLAKITKVAFRNPTTCENDSVNEITFKLDSNQEQLFPLCYTIFGPKKNSQ